MAWGVLIESEPLVFEYPACFIFTILDRNSKRANDTKSGQPADGINRPLYLFFLLKSHLLTRVSVRSCVCGIATVKTLLQTANVRVCSEDYTVKKVVEIVLLLSLVSHIFKIAYLMISVASIRL